MAFVLHYLFIVLCALGISYFLGIFTGAPYVPSRRDRVTLMLVLAGVKRGDRFADIGSGDGRIVIAAAQLGADAVGYEINPYLVWVARRNIRRAGVAHLARVEWRSFWRADFSQFNAVAVYGVTSIMPALERKLLRELPPGARVASNGFEFPNWEPQKTDGGVRVYVKCS